MERSNLFKNNKNTNQPKTLSQKEIAEVIAAAWNIQNISLLEPYLDEDFDYNGTDRLGLSTGKDLYLEYMGEKFNSFKKHGIIYQAEVSEKDNESCVICKTNEADDMPIIIEFEVNNGLIKKMQIRAETMFSLEDLDIPERHAIIERNIVKSIHFYVDELVESLGYESHDLEWLQAYPINDAPSFQHLCFRLGKAVFSLRILVYQASHESEENPIEAAPLSCFFVNDEANHLRECEQNNLIPCVASIDVNCLYEPRIWDAKTYEPVDFKKLESMADSAMSEWEIWNWGVQIVVNYLHSQNIDSLTYTNFLKWYPQIYYEKNGVKHFVYIYTHPSGIDKIPPINKSVIKDFPSLKGDYANISLSNMFGTDGWTFRTEVLSRTAGLLHDRVELMPIEEAIEKYGTTETKAPCFIPKSIIILCLISILVAIVFWWFFSKA